MEMHKKHIIYGLDSESPIKENDEDVISRAIDALDRNEAIGIHNAYVELIDRTNPDKFIKDFDIRKKLRWCENCGRPFDSRSGINNHKRKSFKDGYCTKGGNRIGF